MKRPPGLWILLSAGVLWLSLQDVYGIRATALIFGKSTTSTTTTEATSTILAEKRSDDEAVTITNSTTSSSNNTENGNSTDPILTGIPQIDYKWDPNLPKELNGYNLSEYPFYERVPNEEIKFKCDGLHDGFYASVPHKCQVYHHCLFGTRYDFLCANYTAFDQKTFICQFVSVVDCVNSKKFWHRNDALYKTESTTSAAPVNLRAAIYTTSPPDGGDPITPASVPRRPAGGGARRPYRPTRRRRPHFEYYDDEYYDDEYYDDRPRSNRGRKRPRPRPKPAYEDDEYEEYDDDRYESRRAGSRRRPYRDRGRNNSKDRRKTEYDDEEEVDDRFEDEDFEPGHKRKKSDDRRKPIVEDDEGDRNRKRPSEKRRPTSSDKREQHSDYDRKTSRKKSGNRRPAYDEEYEDELLDSDDRSYEERPRKKEQKVQKEEATSSDGRPIVKPVTGTIYDRPRVAPRINLPVPKNAADKYAYKALGNSQTITTTTTTSAPIDEEYEEEYEEALPKRSGNHNQRPSTEGKRERLKSEDSKSQPSSARSKTRQPDSQEPTDTVSTKLKFNSSRNRYRTTINPKRKPVPVSQEYEDEEYVDEQKELRPTLRNEKKPSTTTTTTTTRRTTTTTTTTTPEPPRKEPIMRIIKRPFLPSRGGSPYSARGLQPVGLKAVDKSIPENDSQEIKQVDKTSASQEEVADYIEEDPSSVAIEEKPVRERQRLEESVDNRKPVVFKPSPVLIKVPVRPKYTNPTAEEQELIDPEPSRQQSYKSKDFSGPRTTQRPKVPEKNPLDLNEYDVTLNDALNPTLPNLPVRSFPTGFSSASDYNYNSYSRPRYVLDPALTPANSQHYIHPNKVVRSQQQFENAPQGQYSTLNGGYRQGQTQALYSGY